LSSRTERQAAEKTSASALWSAIVPEPVLDRPRVLRDAPDAFNIVAMLDNVADIGMRAVGQARAFALMLRGAAREIVLVARVAERASGVATDVRYGLPL